MKTRKMEKISKQFIISKLILILLNIYSTARQYGNVFIVKCLCFPTELWMYLGVHLFIRSKSTTRNVLPQGSKYPLLSTVRSRSFLTAASIAAMIEWLMTRWVCRGRQLSFSDTWPSWYCLCDSLTRAYCILHTQRTFGHEDHFLTFLSQSKRHQSMMFLFRDLHTHALRE